MRERLTSASGSSSWPTTAARDYKGESGAGRQERKGNPADTLPNAVAQWPSPIASEVRQGFQDRSRGMKGSQESLTTVVMKSWPATDASNHRDGAVLRTDNNLEQGGFHGVSLHHAMTKYGQAAPANPSTHGSRQGLWPTATVGDSANAANKTASRLDLTSNHHSGTTLVDAMRQWGTPTARDHKRGRGNEEREYKELTPMVERTQTGKLNPRWVETLMGLPVGWVMPSCASPVTIELTNCDSSATESCQPPQSELFEF